MFQSHLYGIESESHQCRTERLDSFNRTFMELKDMISEAIDNVKIGFNRTFMELKVVRQSNVSGVSTRFNRTFMELKVP